MLLCQKTSKACHKDSRANLYSDLNIKIIKFYDEFLTMRGKYPHVQIDNKKAKKWERTSFCLHLSVKW